MSIPIRHCLIAKAANGDEQAFQRLLAAMEYNMRHGAFSLYPCDHEPRCECTIEAATALDNRLTAALEAAKARKAVK